MPIFSAADQAERGAIPASAGIGLRFPHHRTVAETRPDIGWFEVHAENYFGGGSPRRYLESIRRDYPVALHGVGLSLGSADGLDPLHLDRLCELARQIEPGLVSEHLSWSTVGGHYLADLLPLPLTEEALAVLCRNIDAAQAALRRQILIENPSSYLQFRHSTIPEWEFLAAAAKRTGCGILCDVNNICVSAGNHGWNAAVYLQALDPAAIGEIHLAGHAVRELDGGAVLRIDDHSTHVCAEVWALYEAALVRFGRVPTLIEWDTNIPPLAVLQDEAARGQRVLDQLSDRSGHARAA